MKLNGNGGWSPACTTSFEKSIDRLDKRAGVPVFSRPSWNPALLSDLLRFTEAGSPARPEGYDCIP